MTEMKSPPTEESAFHGQSIPLVRAKPAHQALFPYFLVVLGTLLVVGVAGYWWLNSATRAEMDSKRLDAVRAQMQKQHDNEVAKIIRDLKRKQHDEKMAEQRDAHAQLAEHAETVLKLAAELETARKQWSELLAAQGREIAARDELLTKYQAIVREQPVIAFDPAAVRERVAPVAKRSRELASGTEITAAPSSDVKQRIDTDIAQANVALEAQVKANQGLRAVLSEAAADGIPAANVDLEEAIELRMQRNEQARLQALEEAEARGREEAERRLREVAEREVKENTDIQIDAATRAFDQRQATIKRLNDDLHAAQKAADEEQVRTIKAMLDNEIAQLRGEAGLAEAEVRVTEAAAASKQSEKELEAERIAQETEKNRLREKAKTRAVASALAPLVGKGYWQPGRALPKGVDAAGVSLSAIKAAGGLDPSPRGMRELYHIGANPKNDRPGGWSAEDRLVGKPLEAWLKNKPAARDTARKAQDLLIELGDILVEVGLLSP